jgi:phosphoglycolate phosphatase
VIISVVLAWLPELGLEMVIVEKGNHSLETGEVIRDVQELRNIMKIVEMRI